MKIRTIVVFACATESEALKIANNTEGKGPMVVAKVHISKDFKVAGEPVCYIALPSKAVIAWVE